MSAPLSGWRYGLLGLPLAFLALPLYVQLPNMYAREFGVPLATLGVLLLVARLADAFFDPWIGGAIDRLYSRSITRVLRTGAVAAVVVAAGFAMLFAPPRDAQPTALLAWAAFALLATYLAYSTLTVAHQAWGAMLGGTDAEQSRIVGWREGFGLAGVLIASVLPALAGRLATSILLALMLVAGCAAWASAARPKPATHHAAPRDWRLPFRDARFRSLLFVFALNGIASAIPATLILFFVQDRLQAAASLEPLFLGSYFLCAALSIPAWLQLVRRFGLARAWLAGMALAVAVFVFAAGLGEGDAMAFVAVCALSGIALGADLALPGALLARVIDAGGQRGRSEGLYFGWWNFMSKLNLALAAGLALPLLAMAGYRPGSRDAQALSALSLAYCLLPCALKCAAALLLHLKFIKKDAFA